MQHVIFNKSDSYDIALLIKTSSLQQNNLERHYVNPLQSLGVTPDSFIGYDLLYGINNKITVTLIKAYLADLLPVLKDHGVKTLCVADSAYFKVLTNERKADVHYGYVLPCAIKGFEYLKVVLVPNYQALYYNPDLQEKLDMGLKTLADSTKGNYQELGKGIIHSAKYVTDPNEVFTVLSELKQHAALVCDVECLSLNFWETGITTIGFAWDQHNGVVIWCDSYDNKANLKVRQLLKDFFYSYSGVLVYHNANFDMKIIINTLFMEHLLDEKGKQTGIEVLTRKFHDTKLITYLATNSCAGNVLKLKLLAHEFAGNYAQDDINDITKIEPSVLTKYNLVDCLSTWYVFNKYYPVMVKDNQLSIYETIMKPSVKVILQMELTGMPINMLKVSEARKILEDDIKVTLHTLENSRIIQQFNEMLQEQTMNAANTKLKKKVKPITDFADVKFNPNSNPNLQQLLYEFLDFPILDKTKAKAPATGGKTLAKLIHHTNDPAKLDLLNALIDFAAADKILGTFIKAFEQSVLKADGHYYLHGSFNIGGTVSGRLSSSAPNLQNIPSSGSKYSKIIKDCFVAPKGWVFMGADFSSLEDRISALTTKDPNKLKVYTDGFDGHCLRAYGYFSNQMPDITMSVESINSIADMYKDLRQKSKAPTFLLTYGGTWHGLVNNVGLSKEEAKSIEANYHNLYQASDEWVKDKLNQAAIDGYVTVAFGLKVRTPLLKQTTMNSSKTPYEAQAEGRTAGNALGQSYGLLNNRAGIELQERTFDSPYRYDILPVAHIHDAQYFLVRDNIEVVEWLNTNLVECMEWQELPEIQHPTVGLGGELSLFYPSWKNEIALPNSASQEVIKLTIQKALTL